MTQYSEHLRHFRAALESSDTEEAIRAAQAISGTRGLTLQEDLAILVLLARDADPRFDPFSQHFLERYCSEDREAAEVLIEVTAVGGLKDPKITGRCEKVLRILTC